MFTPFSYHRNYAEFVVISKEIATLETEMLELKGVLEEWRTVPESLEGGWGDTDLLLDGKCVQSQNYSFLLIFSEPVCQARHQDQIAGLNEILSQTSPHCTNPNFQLCGKVSKDLKSYFPSRPVDISSPNQPLSSNSMQRRTKRNIKFTSSF